MPMPFKVCCNCGRRAGRRVRFCRTCFPPGLRTDLLGRRMTRSPTIWRNPTDAEAAEHRATLDRREALLQSLLSEEP